MSFLSSAITYRINNIIKHPNADSLSIVDVDGHNAIVRNDDFQVGDLAVWVPFDLIIPDDPDFPEFCRAKKVKPSRLRGIFSYGLILKNVWDFESEGMDVTDVLNIVKYDPEEHRSSGGGTHCSKNGIEISGPSGIVLSKYDLESVRKYKGWFELGEDVVIEEKLDGSNYGAIWHNNELWVRSRNRWIGRELTSDWWEVAIKYELEKLKQFPDVVFYGEMYGKGKMSYDYTGGAHNLRIFDCYDAIIDDWWYADERNAVCSMLGLDVPPLLYRGAWEGLEAHESLAEGSSLIGSHIREGFVVRPVKERKSSRGDRVIAKLHGQGYLLRK